MKKLIIVFATIVITAGVYAQTDSKNQETNPSQNPTMHSKSGDQVHPDGVMKQNGKMLKVKNGRITTLNNDITLSNGTKIICDGNYYKEDGTKLMMENGQHLDMSGNLTFVAAYLDGVMMENGKIVLVKDGQLTSLDHDITMSNGTTIMSDGNYVKVDGSKMKLEEGQHLDMAGNLTLLKGNKDKSHSE